MTATHSMTHDPLGMDYIFYVKGNIINLPWQDLLQQVSQAASTIQYKISRRKKLIS